MKKCNDAIPFFPPCSPKPDCFCSCCGDPAATPSAPPLPEPPGTNDQLSSSVYQTGPVYVTIMTGTDISFGDNYNTVGDAITHDSPSTDFKITEDGLYRVTYYVYFFSQTGTASFQIHNYGSSLDSVNVTDSRTPMEAIKSTVLPLPAGAVLTLEFLGMLNGDVDAVEVYYSSIKIEKIGNL